MRTMTGVGLIAFLVSATAMICGFPAFALGTKGACVQGWTVDAALHECLLPLTFSMLREDHLLRTGGKATLYAVGHDATDYHPERKSVVLVHGLGADPDVLQSIADRLSSQAVQLYILAFNDFFRRTSLNGEDFAEELLALMSKVRDAGRHVTLVAHSMGGTIGRVAMNELASNANQHAVKRLRLIAVDTPWHGYIGPSDRGLGGVLTAISRPFIPDGLEDMRALSGMFVGEPNAQTFARRAGLYGVPLPDHFEVRLLFAEQPGVVLRPGESSLSQLTDKLAQYYTSRDVGARGCENDELLACSDHVITVLRVSR